jgi:hypothetical protein
MTTGLLTLALLPMMAAVSPEVPPSALDGTMPVAIVQPLAAMDGAPLVTMPGTNRSNPMLPESGMLVLVGSALLGLAAIVRRTM